MVNVLKFQFFKAVIQKEYIFYKAVIQIEDIVILQHRRSSKNMHKLVLITDKSNGNVTKYKYNNTNKYMLLCYKKMDDISSG